MEELLVPSYKGFKTLEPLIYYFPLPIDQLNFVITQVFGLFVAFFLRQILRPFKVSTNYRLLYCLVFGFSFLYFCFGNDILHVLLVCSISYILIRQSLNFQHFHIVLAVFTFSYLTFVHISRMASSYHTYSLDVTGPLMVMTQKLTNLAFSLHDGLYIDKSLKHKKQQLTPLLERRAIKKIPTLLEFFSYCFHFQTVLAGPLCFYKDFMEYINGHNFIKHYQEIKKYQITPRANINDTHNKILNNGNHADIGIKKDSFKTNAALETKNSADNDIVKQRKISENEELYEPQEMFEACNRHASILKPFCQKGATCIALAIILLKVKPLFPIDLNYNYTFIHNYSIIHRTFYLYVSNGVQRVKYYFAWMCADLVSNVSGLGFNGFKNIPLSPSQKSEYDKTGNRESNLQQQVIKEPDWNLISNIHIWAFETSLSLHAALANWNTSTMAWLRHLVYERIAHQRTLAVYIVSALWHGLWPGYYLTFVSGALFTEAAKMNRRKYRNLFMCNKYVATVYHAITFILTRIVLAYVSTPFVILRLLPSLIIYESMYYWPHVLALVSMGLYYVNPPDLSHKKSPTHAS